MIYLSRFGITTLAAAAALSGTTALMSPMAHADGDVNTLGINNKRLNDGVINNVFTAKKRAGCTNDIKWNPQLQLAAQRHTDDVLNNHNLDGDVGSDGSGPQDRANGAGYHGRVAETVAINPALAINGLDIMNQWFNNPAYTAIMGDCANTQIGVWSENSFNRSVVVAVYGQPDHPEPTNQPPQAPRPEGQPPQPLDVLATGPAPLDPALDYDMSDELEHGLDWFPWFLRGVVPAPAIPPG